MHSLMDSFEDWFDSKYYDLVVEFIENNPKITDEFMMWASDKYSEYMAQFEDMYVD